MKHLNKACKTEVEKARAYFRWLTTRDLNSLPDGVGGIGGLLKEIKMNDNYNDYSTLYVDMCT